jgi:hypothetical protein
MIAARKSTSSAREAPLTVCFLKAGVSGT